MTTHYGFIVDTNQYSGNFEREMCAFMTGHIGDCGVGDEEADTYLESYSPLPGVINRPDEHGCYRPVEICITSGVWNNGMGFHFKDGEEEIALEKLKEQTKEYKEQQIKRLESYRAAKVTAWSDEAVDKDIARCQKEINEVLALTETPKYPAYQSVLIHFEEQPSDEVIQFVKKRAEEFASLYEDKELTITGYRLFEKEEIIRTKFV